MTEYEDQSVETNGDAAVETDTKVSNKIGDDFPIRFEDESGDSWEYNGEDQHSSETDKTTASEEGSEKESPASEEKPPTSYKIGEKEYTIAEIEAWQKDSQNKDEWSKSNTQKAQELAELRKALEPAVAVIEALKKGEDDEDVETIVDALRDVVGSDRVDALLNFDASKEVEHPAKNELAQMQEKYQQLDVEHKFMNEFVAFAEKHDGMTIKQARKVLSEAEERYNKSGVFLPLDNVYELMQAEKIKRENERLKNKVDPLNTPASGKKAAAVPSAGGKGARSIKEMIENIKNDDRLTGFFT